MQLYLLPIPLEHEMEMDMLYVCHVIQEIMKNVSGLQGGAITMVIRKNQALKIK